MGRANVGRRAAQRSEYICPSVGSELRSGIGNGWGQIMTWHCEEGDCCQLAGGRCIGCADETGGGMGDIGEVSWERTKQAMRAHRILRRRR